MTKIRELRKPRCFLVNAIAPEGTTPPEANRLFNAFVADSSLPLVLFHDHFLGELGGVAIFFVDSAESRDALLNHAHLTDWNLDYRPLIYAHNPAAFDAQIAYTMRAYRDADWETVRQEQRPAYGNPRLEVETGVET